MEASLVLGIPRTTLLGWASLSVKKNYVTRWFDLVAKLTWAEVKKNFSSAIVGKYDSVVDDESTIDLSKYRELKGDTVVLSKFSGIPAAKRAKLSRRATHAEARGEKSVGGAFSILNRGDKMQVRLRKSKYQEMAKKVTDFILVGWYSGTPVTRHGCYETVMETCVVGSDFYNPCALLNEAWAEHFFL